MAKYSGMLIKRQDMLTFSGQDLNAHTYKFYSLACIFAHLQSLKCIIQNKLYLLHLQENKMNIEIAEKIAKGNKAYYANSKLIKSKLLKKNTKMKIYKTMIRPVITYSSETWTLTAKDENNLRIFERQILSKISGSWFRTSL